MLMNVCFIVGCISCVLAIVCACILYKIVDQEEKDEKEEREERRIDHIINMCKQTEYELKIRDLERKLQENSCHKS